jgi:23S rRNA (adenine2030-N6)-methyltransferase
VLARRLRRSRIPKVLRIEVDFETQQEPQRLVGCGLIVVNPPWTLADDANILMPLLGAIFQGHYRIDWIDRDA